MKYNKTVWNCMQKYLDYTDNKWVVLIHHKSDDDMFAYHIFKQEPIETHQMVDIMLRDVRLSEYLTQDEINQLYHIMSKEYSRRILQAI